MDNANHLQSRVDGDDLPKVRRQFVDVQLLLFVAVARDRHQPFQFVSAGLDLLVGRFLGFVSANIR